VRYRYSPQQRGDSGTVRVGRSPVDLQRVGQSAERTVAVQLARRSPQHPTLGLGHSREYRPQKRGFADARLAFDEPNGTDAAVNRPPHQPREFLELA
jgi:hypothetical protein